MNSADRIIERLNYDMDEIQDLKSECLIDMCSLGEKIDLFHKKMSGETNMNKLKKYLDELADLSARFNELKEIYQDLVDDIRAITKHIKLINDLKVKEAILLLA